MSENTIIFSFGDNLVCLLDDNFAIWDGGPFAITTLYTDPCYFSAERTKRDDDNEWIIYAENEERGKREVASLVEIDSVIIDYKAEVDSSKATNSSSNEALATLLVEYVLGDCFSTDQFYFLYDFNEFKTDYSGAQYEIVSDNHSVAFVFSIRKKSRKRKLLAVWIKSNTCPTHWLKHFLCHWAGVDVQNFQHLPINFSQLLFAIIAAKKGNFETLKDTLKIQEQSRDTYDVSPADKRAGDISFAEFHYLKDRYTALIYAGQASYVNGASNLLFEIIRKCLPDKHSGWEFLLKLLPETAEENRLEEFCRIIREKDLQKAIAITNEYVNVIVVEDGAHTELFFCAKSETTPTHAGVASNWETVWPKVGLRLDDNDDIVVESNNMCAAFARCFGSAYTCELIAAADIVYRRVQMFKTYHNLRSHMYRLVGGNDGENATVAMSSDIVELNLRDSADLETFVNAMDPPIVLRGNESAPSTSCTDAHSSRVRLSAESLSRWEFLSSLRVADFEPIHLICRDTSCRYSKRLRFRFPSGATNEFYRFAVLARHGEQVEVYSLSLSKTGNDTSLLSDQPIDRPTLPANLFALVDKDNRGVPWIVSGPTADKSRRLCSN